MTDDVMGKCGYFMVLYGIGLTSFIFYRSDGRQETYEGKHEPIPSVPGAGLLIKICFYGTMVVATLVPLRGRWGGPLLVLWDDPMARVAASALGLAGLALFVTAKTTLGRHYTPCFNAYLPHGIMDRGVYALIRHPIYAANLLLFAAAFVGSGSAWIGVALLTMYVLYRGTVRLEEAHLTAFFARYGAYVKRSGRFVPTWASLRAFYGSSVSRMARSSSPSARMASKERSDT
jgi:protein-S-isoprenylcysteine O-methyltransferase Ste14